MNELIAQFIFFFAIIDPIGTIPVFIACTARLPAERHRSVAIKAALVAALVLMFFVLVGELLLDYLGVSLPAFQAAGGIILLLFSLSMIFGESKPDEEIKLSYHADDVAIFPLAVPSLAGPASIIGAVLMTENSRYGVPEQIMTTLIILVVLLLAMICMLFAGWISRLIGRQGANLVSRVMGLILAAIAVDSLMTGIADFFGIATNV